MCGNDETFVSAISNDFNKIKLGVRDKLGKYFYKETGSKPMIIVVIQEI